MKFSIFTTETFCILHGQVFVMNTLVFDITAVGVTSLSHGQDEGARQRYRHKSTLLDLIDRNVDLRMKTDISRQQQDRRLARELVSLLLGKGSVSRYVFSRETDFYFTHMFHECTHLGESFAI